MFNIAVSLECALAGPLQTDSWMNLEIARSSKPAR